MTKCNSKKAYVSFQFFFGGVGFFLSGGEREAGLSQDVQVSEFSSYRVQSLCLSFSNQCMKRIVEYWEHNTILPNAYIQTLHLPGQRREIVIVYEFNNTKTP